jgi:DHA2 family multidrug resistance protein
MTLSPGGVAVMLMMPVVGLLMSRVDLRLLIGVGLTSLTLALFYMSTHLNVGIDFHTAWVLRVYQAVGLAFLFVPINALAYTGVPPEKSNAVSGTMNVSRNLGGSIGIALVTTLIARRSQFHQTELASHTTPYDPHFAARVQGIAGALVHAGSSAADATHQALAAVYGQMLRQAMQLAYLDAIRFMAVAVACMVPLLFLMKGAKAGPQVPV